MGGVTFILQRALIAPEKIQTHVLWPGRALMIKLSWASVKEKMILNIYIPINRSQHKDFWEHIEQERQRKRLPKPDFIFGDFNVIEDAIDRAPASENESTMTVALRNVRLAWGIQDQWRHDNPNKRAFIHHHIREGSYKFARLDRIYTKRNLANCLYEWKICEPTAPTDHSLVSVKFAPKDSHLIGKGCWTCPVKAMEDDHLMEIIIHKGITMQQQIERLTRLPTDKRPECPQVYGRALKMISKKPLKKNTSMRTTRSDQKSKTWRKTLR